MGKSESWLLTRLYYAVKRETSGHDLHCDLIFTGLVKPLFQEFGSAASVRWKEFMRFSENGYHARFRFYGDSEVLERDLKPAISDRVQIFVDAEPEVFSGVQELSEISLKLNQKRSAGREIQLFRPGHYSIGFLDDTDERLLFESDHAREAFFDLSGELCMVTLELLSRDIPFPVRKVLVRQMLDDALRLAELTPAECYLVLRYLEAQWVDYFALGDQRLEFMRAYHEERRLRYFSYLNAKKNPEASLRLLPPVLHPGYMDLISILRRYLPAVICREPDGSWSRYSLLRLFALFHLSHNRIGLGIFDEIFLAYVLRSYYQELLGASEVAQLEDLVKSFLASERAGSFLAT